MKIKKKIYKTIEDVPVMSRFDVKVWIAQRRGWPPPQSSNNNYMDKDIYE